MSLKTSITQLIQEYYKNRQIVQKKSQLRNLEVLQKEHVVVDIVGDDSKVRINPGNSLLCEVLLEECKRKLEFEEPTSIDSALSIVNAFEDVLKEENDLSNSNRPFRQLTDGLAGHLLTLLRSNGVDVMSHALKSMSTKSSDQFIDPFEQAFIYHLLNSEYGTEEIYQFCQSATESQNQYLIRSLLGEINNNHSELLVKLYTYGDSKTDLVLCEFQLRIIPRVFGLMPVEVFDKMITIISTHPDVGLRLLSQSNLSTEQTKTAIEHSERLINERQLGYQHSNLFYSIASGNVASFEQRKQVYALWYHLMTNADDKLRESIISDVGMVDKNEDEEMKFGILVNYLALTGNFKVVSDFFYQFKSPRFLYKMLSDAWQQTEGRKTHILKMFNDPIRHFFRSNPSESERWILEFFDPKYQLGTLPIDIIMLDHPDIFQVDLTKLEDEQVLLGAIHKFYYVTIQFDTLLPMLLELRNSKYPKVVESLQQHLAFLVIESYGEDLLNWIVNIIGNKEKKFLKPIREAVKADKKISEKKRSTRELNPYFNEKNNIEQYESLAHENRTQAMSEARNSPGFLASFFKNTIIIRGNSTQHGDCNSEVRPLGHIRSAVSVDSRIYKNPDLLEFQMRNIDK